MLVVGAQIRKRVQVNASAVDLIGRREASAAAAAAASNQRALLDSQPLCCSSAPSRVGIHPGVTRFAVLAAVRGPTAEPARSPSIAAASALRSGSGDLPRSLHRAPPFPESWDTLYLELAG